MKQSYSNSDVLNIFFEEKAFQITPPETALNPNHFKVVKQLFLNDDWRRDDRSDESLYVGLMSTYGYIKKYEGFTENFGRLKPQDMVKFTLILNFLYRHHKRSRLVKAWVRDVVDKMTHFTDLLLELRIVDWYLLSHPIVGIEPPSKIIAWMRVAPHTPKQEAFLGNIVHADDYDTNLIPFNVQRLELMKLDLREFDISTLETKYIDMLCYYHPQPALFIDKVKKDVEKLPADVVEDLLKTTTHPELVTVLRNELLARMARAVP